MTQDDISFKKKVLILTGDVGGGHLAPAKSVKNAFEERFPGEFEVSIIDVFTETDVAPFNTSNASYALFSQNYTLELINELFFILLSTRPGNWLFSSYVKSRLLKPTLSIIKAEKPDIIITNNPIVTIVANGVKATHKNIFSVIQVTDLETMMRCWADHNADLTIYPAEGAKRKLMSYGIKGKRLAGPLFPIRQSLANPRPREQIRAELSIGSDERLILFTSGGVGLNKFMLQAIDSMLEEESTKIIILAGKLAKNENLLRKRYALNDNVQVFGFVDNIQDFYEAADVVVAKPGTSTLLELDLFRKRAVFTRKVGRQEVGNVWYAINNMHAVYLGNSWNLLPEKVNKIMKRGEPSTTTRRSSEAIDIVTTIVESYRTSLNNTPTV